MRKFQKRPVARPDQTAQTFTVSLRPDRIAWVKATATAQNVSYSEIVRALIDEARKQTERESMTA